MSITVVLTNEAVFVMQSLGLVSIAVEPEPEEVEMSFEHYEKTGNQFELVGYKFRLEGRMMVDGRIYHIEQFELNQWNFSSSSSTAWEFCKILHVLRLEYVLVDPYVWTPTGWRSDENR